ncbi:uncharacterized protein LOC124811548 isoform X3 [Hydra vulgaris]|uniref:uncharacterized protein LOC124811548 isoform X3 n=1 Tax=Hydra vulgaris TaxID=6087 RepID=UPI001F5FAC4D|nr:uncharacterized protein LOC124811548 isoform X4 [Hydra vulgaris]
MLQFKTLLLNVLLTNSICCQFYYDTTYKSDNSLVYSLQKTYPAAHYEAFLRCPTSSSAMSALVPSSIALSVPSTSAIIVTSSAATSGIIGSKKSGAMFADEVKKD